MPEPPTPSPSSDSHPLVLFDGVCNLCDAAVRWIIARDRHERFRFASLQSKAGRAALERAGAVDDTRDSIVLIDERGVHAHSDAVLAIARGLGFPWSLASAARILPRALRDRLYSWIASNRYRWFGRQNACMIPTAALRRRFLDADEPVVVTDGPAPAGDPLHVAEPGTTGSAATTCSFVALPFLVARRFLIAYLVLYVLPFPLGLFGDVAGAAAAGRNAMRAAVVWTGSALFGKEITVFPAGSGDTTYNYVELVVLAATAAAITIAWTAWKRRSRVAPRTDDLFRTYIRYYLAVFMLSYGWAKVFPNQMPAPGPDRLLGTVGDMSPMGLAWTFVGTSAAYQIFAGAGEVLAGLLLLWRRTSLAGALVAAVVMTNVVALNFFYDVPVKLFSSHLLLVALVLCVPHLPRLLAVLVLNLPSQPVDLRPFPFRRAWTRWTARVLKACVVLVAVAAPAIGNWRMMHQFGRLAPTKAWHGIYRVESFRRDGAADRELADADRWVRVGLGSTGLGAIQRADGTSRRMLMAVDETRGTLTITRRDDPVGATLSFAMPAPDRIVLSGVFDHEPIEVTLVRADESESLLTSRGFHWINEFPLNR